MKIFYITFRSVTFAQRAERVLSEGGYHCTLQRTPKWMEEQGCGYAIRIWTGDVKPAMWLLRQEQIPVRRLYRQGHDGQLEEMGL